uniref:Uncharacterized protein n=1 Tax=Nelumbo nucifera TaxID=4432 RepID=A0A822Y980_NELNU|nr:TPA_asm: hypothetical protein HUJ06_027616 [Nelumbo nucifera]
MIGRVPDPCGSDWTMTLMASIVERTLSATGIAATGGFQFLRLGTPMEESICIDPRASLDLGGSSPRGLDRRGIGHGERIVFPRGGDSVEAKMLMKIVGLFPIQAEGVE